MMEESEVTPTPEQIEGYCQKLIAKFKHDPDYELRIELGKMLVRHIDSFTKEERDRYDELLRLLNNPPPPHPTNINNLKPE